MKRKLPVLIGILCVLCIAIGAYAATAVQEITAQLRPDFEIEIDGEEREFYNVDGERVYPILYEGTTYLPVRAIGEIMNKKVYWFEKEKRIELKEINTTVTDADVIITEPEKDKDKTKEEKIKEEKPKVDTSEFIAPNMAKKIALTKAGLAESEVILEKVELDKEDGVWVYEVEFSKGYTEYDIYINALDGEILKFETDIED